MLSAGNGSISAKVLFGALRRLSLEHRNGDFDRGPPCTRLTGVGLISHDSVVANFLDYDQGYNLKIQRIPKGGNQKEDIYISSVSSIPTMEPPEGMFGVVAVDYNGNGLKDLDTDNGDFAVLEQLMRRAMRFAENPSAFQKIHCSPKSQKKP